MSKDKKPTKKQLMKVLKDHKFVKQHVGKACGVHETTAS